MGILAEVISSKSEITLHVFTSESTWPANSKTIPSFPLQASINFAVSESPAKELNVVLVQTANVQSTFCPFAAEEERMLYIDLND